MTAFNNKEFGSITVNFGGMYSGKTEELQRQIKRKKIAGKKYQIFKPLTDNRYSEDKVVTHYGYELDALVVKNANEILERIEKDTEVIGIDEVQFFNKDIIEVCQKLKREYHVDIIISGLDMKFNGEPFEVTALLAAISDKCIKFNAVCVKCGEDAYISHRIINNNDDIVVGSEGMYVALCEKDWLKENK